MPSNVNKVKILLLHGDQYHSNFTPLAQTKKGMIASSRFKGSRR
jgi:hypothetical protein